MRYLLPGLTPYVTAWDWQRDMIRRRCELPPDDVSSGGGDPGAPLTGISSERWRAFRDVVFMLQHPPVYTCGRSTAAGDLRFTPGDGRVAAEVHAIDRGGKITYHGPGQLVVYPVLDLTRYRKDLHWYVTTIEDVIIGALGELGVTAHRARGYPGVWVGDEKVAQVGMHCTKWYTMHGFAINVDPDMSYFNHIVPCGIADKAVTSLARLTARPITVEQVVPIVARHFEAAFGVTLVDPPPGSHADPLATDGPIAAVPA